MIDISHLYIYIHTQQYTTYHISYIVYHISYLLRWVFKQLADLGLKKSTSVGLLSAEVSPSKERPFSSCLTIHDVHPTRPSWCRGGTRRCGKGVAHRLTNWVRQRNQCDHSMAIHSESTWTFLWFHVKWLQPLGHDFLWDFWELDLESPVETGVNSIADHQPWQYPAIPLVVSDVFGDMEVKWPHNSCFTYVKSCIKSPGFPHFGIAVLNLRWSCGKTTIWRWW